jgi:Ni,Fe-hydrogenase I small subunit
MTIEITPRASGSTASGRRIDPASEQSEDDTTQAKKLGLRHRYFLQLADLVTLTASAARGALAILASEKSLSRRSRWLSHSICTGCIAALQCG